VALARPSVVVREQVFLDRGKAFEAVGINA
jgi:hypothetical protein